MKITSQATGLKSAKRRRMTPVTSWFRFYQCLFTQFESMPQGFAAAEQKDIRLASDEQRELNFTLQPASVSSSVEVNATELRSKPPTNPGQVITSRTGFRTSVEWHENLCSWQR